MKIATLYVFLQNFLSLVEKRGIADECGANGNTIPAMETQNVPRLISTPREDFQFVFEGLDDKE